MTKLYNNEIKLDRRFENLLARLMQLQARPMEIRLRGEELKPVSMMAQSLAEFADKEEEQLSEFISLRESIQEAMRRREQEERDARRTKQADLASSNVAEASQSSAPPSG